MSYFVNKYFLKNLKKGIREMTEVINIGLDVFGSMEKFKLWLNTPNFSLSQLKPAELLKIHTEWKW